MKSLLIGEFVLKNLKNEFQAVKRQKVLYPFDRSTSQTHTQFFQLFCGYGSFQSLNVPVAYRVRSNQVQNIHTSVGFLLHPSH